MTVVVRLPAIPADPDTGGGTAGAARPAAHATPAAAPRAPVPVPEPGARTPVATRPRGVRRHARFPLATTLLLAAAAGACWLAVWRAERLDRRVPERDTSLAAFGADVAGDAPAAADGGHATASGTSGSVVR